ncbi:Pyocin activator protein PrtN [Rhodoblastus acidophilus]|uniref:Pyocin activator protein PrtN n=1 Tax=Rhodoblastus acidophilus TaxID=1074 RepID=A0A6N8DLG0_RHOAC|nr:pyocin activator PrtN family protein [Rhodoblastus acidophilus]MCW2275089.1 hypothetical protein [Rhodoblastus acidophilus]MTV31360.1 Pyocin activator protein PrtN [Rhodoblastus acidophilus]
MNTAFLLMAQYQGLSVIPLDAVCRDYFCHLTPPKLAAKIERGEIKLPMVRIERSQKAAKGVHLTDLADWIDARRDAAAKELKAIG